MRTSPLVRPEPVTTTVPAAQTAVRVLIADDHPLYRRGLSRAIRRAPELELVAEAVDGAEALELAVTLCPDVVVLDQRMPHVTGIEAARMLRATGSDTAVVLLTAFDDDEMQTLANDAGATFVPKTATTAEILAAVMSAHA